MQGKILIIFQEKMRKRKFPYRYMLIFTRQKSCVILQDSFLHGRFNYCFEEKERERKNETKFSSLC